MHIVFSIFLHYSYNFSQFLAFFVSPIALGHINT
jgi:hypothetical protein